MRETGGMGTVTVVGGINQDVVVRAERRPRAGETVVGTGPVLASGGKGANMAVAVARAGTPVILCGAVGGDPAGHAQLAELRAEGVTTEHVGVRDDAATGVAMIVVTPDGQNSITVGTGANASLDPADIVAACEGSAVVMAQTEVGAAPADVAASYAAGAGARFVLSLAPVLPVLASTLQAADPLVVNEEEAADVLGESVPADPLELVRALVDRTGCRSAVVSLGREGAVLAEGDTVVHLASPVVEAVDTTGAGDVLTGVLAAALADGASLGTALATGIAAAAESVRHAGARGRA